ncbi:MAG: DUF4296 domain-containing protein [Ferruginibacter sp.]|nr:DUF4296 domain-containing protein [Ferruginibacter sp.]
MRKLLIFFIISVLFSCTGGEKIPLDVIPPSKMEIVLWDFIKADVYSNQSSVTNKNINDTALNKKMQEVIFKQHGVSREVFFKSYDYYLAHPKKMTVILDSILSKHKNIQLGKFQTTIPDFRER